MAKSAKTRVPSRIRVTHIQFRYSTEEAKDLLIREIIKNSLGDFFISGHKIWIEITGPENLREIGQFMVCLNDKLESLRDPKIQK